MINSAIQWTDHTWNIARGCTKVDEDCKYCYMYRQSLNGTRYEPKQVIRTKTVFNLPLKIQEPAKFFTSSLTDFFHPDIDGYRHEAWEIIRRCPQHTFQILTKRPERIRQNLPLGWNSGLNFQNVWLGTSIGHQSAQRRVIDLLRIPAPSGLLFLSCEPLHGPININQVIREEDGYAWCDDALTGFKAHGAGGWYGNKLGWVIVGGESGNNKGQYRYRECKLEWIESIIEQCRAARIPVFVKQLGTHLAKELKLVDRHGGDINEWPEHLRVREMPEVNHG